ncbi:MAG TPA: SDR family oxidoreductase [Candidatus Acidoferrum sp.]|jgi:pteridine reductase
MKSSDARHGGWQEAGDSATRLDGKVALVTGSARRLGRAMALNLAAQGADLVVHYHHSGAEAKEAVSEIRRMGRRAICVAADLGKKADIARLVSQAEKEFGRLDILINNASNFLHADFATTTEEIWDAALDVNLKAPFFCAQAAAPMLRKNYGVIINLSDVGGLLGWTGYIPHCVSKAGIIMLTRVLAKELAPDVRVNAIAPGTISMEGDPENWEADYIKRTPLRRSGTTEDVTSTVSFLVHSRFVTGQVLILDGGRTLGASA